jgi:hypothetical protein
VVAVYRTRGGSESQSRVQCIFSLYQANQADTNAWTLPPGGGAGGGVYLGVRGHEPGRHRAGAGGRGGTLVRFSPQPEPLLATKPLTPPSMSL